MLLFLLAALVGVIAGSSLGGRLGALAELRFRAPGLLLAAVGGQLLLAPPVGEVPAGVRPVMLAGSYAGVGAWLVLNARGRVGGVGVGLVLLTAGWLLNLAVVVPNGGMPVSRPALERLDAAGVDGDSFGLEKHVVAGSGTRLRALGDVIAVPPLRAVVSVGDLVMAAGVGAVVAGAMVAPARRATRATASSGASR